MVTLVTTTARENNTVSLLGQTCPPAAKTLAGQQVQDRMPMFGWDSPTDGDVVHSSFAHHDWNEHERLDDVREDQRRVRQAVPDVMLEKKREF